jgi:hypothetical protein
MQTNPNINWMDYDTGELIENQEFYVDCVANSVSQYPVVRTREHVVARNFKGVMFEEAEQRAKKLAGILNSRPTPRAVDGAYCACEDGSMSKVLSGKCLLCGKSPRN